MEKMWKASTKVKNELDAVKIIKATRRARSLDQSSKPQQALHQLQARWLVDKNFESNGEESDVMRESQKLEEILNEYLKPGVELTEIDKKLLSGFYIPGKSIKDK